MLVHLTRNTGWLYFIGHDCGMVKPFYRKYAAVRIAALQNFVSSAFLVVVKTANRIVGFYSIYIHVNEIR